MTPATVVGTVGTPVSVNLSGLAPHTTYYYRLKASNMVGTTTTTGGSFTTLNSPPVAFDDRITVAPKRTAPITLATLENDSDADGEPLSIVAVSQGAFGSVHTNGSTVTYTPGLRFAGTDTFTYTISDGLATATAQVRLLVRRQSIFTRVLFTDGAVVPGAGEPDSGIATGSLFTGFGVPSINSSGRIALVARCAPPGFESKPTVLRIETLSAKSISIARRGQNAAGTEGARFTSFKDPLLNAAGDIVFIAEVSGGDSDSQRGQGIWICPSSQSGNPQLTLLARTGTPAEGVRDQVHWKSFTSLAFASIDAGNAIDASGNWLLGFTAHLSTGASGVNAANDLGFWISTAEGTVLALREGQRLQLDGSEKELRTFTALRAVPGASGQGNGVSSAGSVTVLASFTDRTQSVLRVSRGAAGVVVIDPLAETGDAVPGFSQTASRFGIPTQSSSGKMVAWLGTLRGGVNSAAIFSRNLNTAELGLISRRGDTAAGVDGAFFAGFRSVTVNDEGDAFFLGTITGRRVSQYTNEGLWWKRASGNPSLQLLAREGGRPPGVAAGVRWKSFESLVLSGGRYGPLFSARLSSERKRSEGAGQVSSADDLGLWGVDSSGTLRLLVREGQMIAVEGSSATKRLRNFSVLNAVPGSPTQRRSLTDEGRIVYRALFQDATEGIIEVQLQ